MIYNIYVYKKDTVSNLYRDNKGPYILNNNLVLYLFKNDNGLYLRL